MLAERNPAELTKQLDTESVEFRRSLFCTWYDDCLDRAAELGWSSWSCEQCRLHALRAAMAARYAQERYFQPVHAAEAALAVTA